MALYQEINKVSGLSGNSYQKQKQLYERLGSPMGSYRGTYDQNIWLLNQIRSGNVGGQPKPQTKPQTAPQQKKKETPQQKIIREYTAPIKETAPNKPVFSEVLPFYKAWERFVPQVTQASNQVINPEIARARRQAMGEATNQIYSSGGNRFGEAFGQLGQIDASARRQKEALLQDYLGQYRSGFENLWYNPTETAYNRAITQGKNFNYKIPTWEDFSKMMGGMGQIPTVDYQTPGNVFNY